MKAPIYGTETPLMELYENMMRKSPTNSHDIKTNKAELFGLIEQCKKFTFGNIIMRPESVQGNMQIYKYDSGVQYVGNDAMHFTVTGVKPLILEDGVMMVGNKPIPLVEGNKLNFYQVEITSKMPNEEYKNFVYTEK